MTCEAVVRRHLPLVRDVAHGFACRHPPRVDLDELISWGMEGLLDAYQRYRPDKHASFRTYARFRVRGVILDNLREHDWMSRTGRRKAVLLDRTRTRLEAALGRTPREEELASELQVDITTLRTMATQTEFGTVSIEDLSSTEHGRTEVDRYMPDHDSDPLLTLLGHERARLLTAALRRLPAKEYSALDLYYRRDLTMREVAERLGISESRVSQLHSQAVRRMRALLRPSLATAE
jgi:RNA polymerase sigma factor for flagellar operon FliA